MEALNDLQFLFACDEKLQEELAYVCTLLDETLPSEATDLVSCDSNTTKDESKSHGGKRKQEAPPSPSMKNKFEFRQKQEMYLLKQQVEDLKKELHTIQVKCTGASQDEMTTWEAAARLELVEKNKSLIENQRLREAMYEQATFIDQMQAVMTKKPRLHMLTEADHEDWQDYKLAAQQSLRVAAIHAIAERQLRRKQNLFIKAGVFNRPEDLFRSRALPLPNDNVLMELVEHITLPAPYHVVASAVWQVMNGERSPCLPSAAIESIEHIDESTVYAKFCDKTCRMPAYSNVIRKRYQGNQSEVVVWRTVREDALMPHLHRGAVDDESGWFEVQAVPSSDDEEWCRLTLLVHVHVDPSLAHNPKWRKILSLENVTTLMEKFSFVQPPPMPGMLAAAPPCIENDSLSRTVVEQYFQKGKRFETALKEAVNHAIAAHQRLLSPSKTFWSS